MANILKNSRKIFTNSGGSGDQSTLPHWSTASLSLADSTIYFFGHELIGATTSGNLTPPNIRGKAATKTGTIRSCVMSIYCGNPGTVTYEASNLYLRNHTTNTNYTIGTFVFSNINVFSVVFNGLDIPITLGDSTSTMIETPVFATNPTGTYIIVEYIIE